MCFFAAVDHGYFERYREGRNDEITIPRQKGPVGEKNEVFRTTIGLKKTTWNYPGQEIGSNHPTKDQVNPLPCDPLRKPLHEINTYISQVTNYGQII